MKTLKIVLYDARKKGHYKWKMLGMNGESLAPSSEPIQNTTYLKALMKTFDKMGFVIENKTKLKI